MCGHIILDQRNDLSYKGRILSDRLLDNVSDFLTNTIDELEEANQSNKRLDWINRKFLPPYPTDLKNSTVIHDLMVRRLMEATQEIFECENCGRIAIEVGQTNRFRFFSPDTDDRGILGDKTE